MTYYSETRETSDGSCIVLSYIARNGVVLVEARNAGYQQYSDLVTETASRLKNKNPTPGWEFAKLPTFKDPRHGGRESKKFPSFTHSYPLKLLGAKFHIQEHNPEEEGGFCTWSVGCVYDADVLGKQESFSTTIRSKFDNKVTAPAPIQSFVQHVIRESREFRLGDDVWKRGGELAAQYHFAPKLAEIMENLTWYDTKAERLQQIDDLKDIMHKNIEMLLERGERMEVMMEKAEELKEQANVFKKNSTKLKKQMKRKHLKMIALYGVAGGTVVTASIAVPLVLLI